MSLRVLDVHSYKFIQFHIEVTFIEVVADINHGGQPVLFEVCLDIVDYWGSPIRCRHDPCFVIQIRLRLLQQNFMQRHLLLGFILCIIMLALVGQRMIV